MSLAAARGWRDPSFEILATVNDAKDRNRGVCGFETEGYGDAPPITDGPQAREQIIALGSTFGKRFKARAVINDVVNG